MCKYTLPIKKGKFLKCKIMSLLLNLLKYYVIKTDGIIYYALTFSTALK